MAHLSARVLHGKNGKQSTRSSREEEKALAAAYGVERALDYWQRVWTRAYLSNSVFTKSIHNDFLLPWSNSAQAWDGCRIVLKG